MRWWMLVPALIALGMWRSYRTARDAEQATRNLAALLAEQVVEYDDAMSREVADNLNV